MTTIVDARELTPYLSELTRRGWTHFYFPNREHPTAIASAYWHETCVDVVQVFDRTDAFAYRAPIHKTDNPFTPDLVLWTYGGDALWTIRQALTLPDPADVNAPNVTLPAPPMCRVLADLASKIRAYVVRPPQESLISRTGR